jgi:hypothetical protein
LTIAEDEALQFRHGTRNKFGRRRGKITRENNHKIEPNKFGREKRKKNNKVQKPPGKLGLIELGP